MNPALIGCPPGCLMALALLPLFSDHMVLQRDRAVPVWGEADPGSVVTAFVDGKPLASGTVDAHGNFRVELPPAPAGGPHEMEVRTDREVRRFEDVYFGDVWVCSGQSNMEWPLKDTERGEDVVAGVNEPLIRLFEVAKHASAVPVKNLQGSWRTAAPDAAAGFSAVAYFFAKEVVRETGVPVGLIGAYWGGSTAEAWIPPDALANDVEFAPLLGRRQNAVFPLGEDEKKAENERRTSERKRLVQAVLSADPGLPVGARGSGPGLDSAWRPISVPGAWEVPLHEHFDGVVWFRREFEVGGGAAPGPWNLHLGVIDDFDDVWINGIRVGGMGLDAVEPWLKPREYAVPPGVLREGANILLVRVVDHGGAGGLLGQPYELFLSGSEGHVVPLAGAWECRIEHRMTFPGGYEVPIAQHTAGLLYDGMIAPLIPYGIRGALWYQGESNAMRAAQYRRLMPKLIETWRTRWGQGDFPFYFVQLPNFQTRPQSTGPVDWAELREAQELALKLPNTGMAVLIDSGDAKDIHPRNKQVVGERLARIALSRDYGKPVVSSGPVLRGIKKQGAKVRIAFDHAEGGLRATGDKAVAGFAVAGADGKFVDGAARIEGSEVVVWSDAVKDPVSVRYGWADNPVVNITNGAGLPLRPFRTDALPLTTAGKR